jgi:ornithine cyclodeaminase/alanine dehydrogenase-like protein (mu-crystallin family)
MSGMVGSECGMTIVVIGRADIIRVLRPEIAFDLVEDAMRRVSRGVAQHLLRRIFPIPGSGGILGDMPGSLGPNAAFGLKSISIYPSASDRRAPHLGFLVLFEHSKGLPVAVLEAGAVTAIRTAAATAVATRLLARRGARTLAILGAGEQAEHHIPALLEAWPFQEIILWARRPDAAQALARQVREKSMVPVRSVSSVREAAEADVICTLTSSDEPILSGEWLSPGAHVNLIGSSTREPREVDSALVTRSRYFVDSRESAQTNAAEFLHAKEQGLVTDDHICGEIGAVITGQAKGRLQDSDVTVYKSLGHIAQDLAVGWYVYERALAEGFGTGAAF